MTREATGRQPWLSLRTRLWLGMLVVLLPGLAYIVTSSVLEHQRARQQAQAELLTLARVAAGNERQSLANMQSRLALVASFDPVQADLQNLPGAGQDCFNRLVEVARLMPDNSSFVVWNLAGGPACPSALPVRPANAADQSWFRQASATHAFAIGNFQIDPDQGQPTITFGYPVSSTDGRVLGVVSSGLDLAQLTETASALALPGDAVVTVFDHGGVVLARSPDAATWDGKTLPDPAGLTSALSNGADVSERADVDGVMRLSAVAPITGPGGDLVYLSIGRPAAAVYGATDTALAVGLAITALLTLLALLLAWRWSGQTLVGPIQGLLAAAQRVAGGDLTARARPQPAGSEVDQLASTFNVLASRLASLEAERQLTEQNLRELDGRLRRSLAHTAQLDAVTAGLAKAATPQQVLEVILRQGAGAVGAITATLSLLSDDGEWLKRTASVGRPDPIDRLFQQYPVSSPLPAADVVRTGETIWIESAGAYRARYPQLTDVINSTDYEAAVAAPLRYAGRLMGVLTLSFPEELAQASDIADYIATLASFCAQGLERARLYDETQRLTSALDERQQAKTARP